MFRLQALGLSLVLAFAAVPARSQELPISSGDQLNVLVAGETELSRTYIVDQDGNITLAALIGKVTVKDMTPAQVRDDLTKKLAKYIKGPQVSVEFKERAQIKVGFTGAVGKPGTVSLPKGQRLLDGLAQAEGIKPDADQKNVRLQRRGEAEPRLLDLSRVLEKDASLNVELKDGDAVYVPPQPVYRIQVLGAVNKPDLFIRKEKMRLLDAILASSGFTEDANRRAVELLRRGKDTPEVYNLETVLQGAASNPLVDDGDTITVPAFRKIAVKVYGSVAKPGQVLVREGTTVQAAVTEAGGFAPDANKASVNLSGLGGETRSLNLYDVDSQDGAVVLTDGAEVRVSPLQRFAVTGGVAKPDIYPLPADGKSKVYLTDALAMAGGPIDRAKKQHLYLFRKDPKTGKPTTTDINYETFLHKKDERLNVEIAANDIIFLDAEPEGREKRGSVFERVAPFLLRIPFGF